MKDLAIALGIALLLLVRSTSAADLPPPDPDTARTWVEEMKERDRGPFKRIRWFCEDGTVLPPKESCKEHGGGVQHGEWSDRTRALREAGYPIATVLADIDPESFARRDDFMDRLKGMILEQYLIQADDGWIFRKARYYRGALQAEDETRKGRELLLTLVRDPEWLGKRFPVLREAVRAVPHGRRGAPLTEMRRLSKTLAETDPGFEPLRIKLHVLPEPADADAVRRYARDAVEPDRARDYMRLAGLVDAVFAVADIHRETAAVLGSVRPRPLSESLGELGDALSTDHPLPDRISAANRLMAALRRNLIQVPDPETRLSLLDLSLALEGFIFKNGAAMVDDARGRIRREILVRLWMDVLGLHGMGLISDRQELALAESFSTLLEGAPSLAVHLKELDHLSRISDWADGTLSFHFSGPMEKMAGIAPLAGGFIQDRLHANPILFTAETLDLLIRDGDRLAGIRHELFGDTVGSGLRALNPGLARGPLRPAGDRVEPAEVDPDGIYLLPVTVGDLPRVAGILTAGQGNTLSHVQLLARNLGIPNVAVHERLFPKLESRAGRSVVVAASPGGVVRIVDDGPRWNGIFGSRETPSDVLIHPDLDKLDLPERAFLRLSKLRARDSGRVCGPKAANLGELKHHFPEAVAEGLVLPFGIFRGILDRPMDPEAADGPTIFGWMEERYAQMEALRDRPRLLAAFTQEFLEQIHGRITAVTLDDAFRKRLRAAMAEAFGPDGSYGVFIRSDTNVEDLPGFTGAGLNLTVPHVVGVDRIIDAIPRVWASPFTERAFGWRQRHMSDPEHLYVSVLLMRSVPVDKSGVLVTVDIDRGDPEWLSVAVNEGPGGAVEGQGAEELRVHAETGEVRLLAQATEPRRNVLLPEGGVAKVPASGDDRVLTGAEIGILVDLARRAPEKFPALRSDAGRPIPADMEFGFLGGRLALFQIRPFLESRKARRNAFLQGLDAHLTDAADRLVDLDHPPSP